MDRVVYEVPCADCKWIYIGETNSEFERIERVKEHRDAMKTLAENGIANIANMHGTHCEHKVDWEAARVRLQEQHCWK